MAANLDAAMWHMVGGNPTPQFNPHGAAILGTLSPLAVAHFRFVGYQIGINGRDAAGNLPVIQTTPVAVPHGFAFCWCCGITIAVAVQTVDPVVFLWPGWSDVPLMIHFHCAYEQLCLNGHEALVYADRLSTYAFQILTCNVLANPDLYPEAAVGQRISMACDLFNLLNPDQWSCTVVNAGEFAYEADLLSIANKLNTEQYRNDFTPTGPPRSGQIQIKRVHFHRSDNPLSGVTTWKVKIEQRHGYLPSTLVIVHCEFPVDYPGGVAGQEIYFLLDGGDLWSIATMHGAVAVVSLTAHIAALATIGTTRNIGAGAGVAITSVNMDTVVEGVREHYKRCHCR